MRIIGIDPGLANTGWGIVDFDGQRFQPLLYGVINTKAGDRLEDRIAYIAENVKKIAFENKAEALSIEDIFFAKNEKSAIGVAKVIGAVCYAMHTVNIPVSVFTPLQIKMAITGNGRADKFQVQEMCRIIMKLEKIPRPDHAADALAAALCLGNTGVTFKRMGIASKRVGI